MLRIRLLGRPSIDVDGVAVPGPRGRKTLALLAVLLLADAPPGRRSLAGLLFPDAAGRAMAAGDATAAVIASARAVTADPHDPDGRAVLISSLVAAGHHAAAGWRRPSSGCTVRGHSAWCWGTGAGRAWRRAERPHDRYSWIHAWVQDAICRVSVTDPDQTTNLAIPA